MSPSPSSAVRDVGLLAELGPSCESTGRLLTGLYRALSGGGKGIERYRARWSGLYCGASDWGAWSRSLGKTRAFQRLCDAMGASPRRPEAALFVVHTYYAMVVKLVCAAALGVEGGQGRRVLADLEGGGGFEALGLEGFTEGGECFAWYLVARRGLPGEELDALWRRVQRCTAAGGAAGADPLKPLYLALVPRPVRHRLGEYYTPDWLALRTLELTMGQDLGDPRAGVVDPACGSGVFLSLAVRRARARALGDGVDPGEALEQILRHVRGQDLNPLAVLAARASYLLALGPLVGARRGPLRLPVTLGDSVLEPPEAAAHVVGNPPWINWEHLPEDHRRRTRELWRRYGLFVHGGMDAILGKGKKDLCALLTCVALERCLAPGGRLGFVLPRGLFKTAGAAEGFRRFRLPGDVPFAPELVEDVTARRPFAGASTQPLIVLFRRDRAVSYPVPYRVWRAGSDEPLAWQAEPVDSGRPESAWLTSRPGALAVLRRVMGASDYTAREGANTGGANGVYWVELERGALKDAERVLVTNVTRGARKKVAQVRAEVEAARLFPLLRGRDVGRWRAEPSIHVVMAQDPQTRRGLSEEIMARDAPATGAYLARFREMLAARPAFLRYFRPDRDPFWSMFNVGPYTLAPHKVVWREQAAGFTAAVAGTARGRPVVPDHKLMLVQAASDGEAHYLCAALNSAPVRLVVAAYAVSIQISTHVLRHVAVPAYRAGDATHRALARISRRAHRAALAGDGAALARVEVSLDQRARELWGLTPGELAEIFAALEEL